jgi:hypothetical protein
MAGGTVITGTADTSRVEAPVTFRAYLIRAFAAFGGIFFEVSASSIEHREHALADD